MKSGFGKHSKTLLSYLFKTGKYDLVEYAAAPRSWSDAHCRSMPWKTYGALPDNLEELEPYQGDQNAIRAIQYGDYNMDKLLKLEKPDVMIMVEDIWGLPYFNRPWINKFPCVFWTPIDSLPLLPIFEKIKGTFKNLWVKARFAVDALKESGVEAKYMPALIENNSFRMFSSEQRVELRTKYNIPESDVIFGFVFRNQLRKLVGTLIEGFAVYKKNNPHVSAKLWLHTDWSVREGWRIKRLAEECGVDLKDIYTTYCCKSCSHAEFINYFGDGQKCPKCGKENSFSTPGVEHGLSDEKLNDFYNLCDAYIHPVTSGGFEMPILEALWSGLPVASVDYAFGSNFTQCPSFHKLNYVFYREITSHYKKAQVSPQSISNYIESIVKMRPAERRNLGNSGRKWALKEFDTKTWCAQVESFIDDCPFTEYDFDFDRPFDENYPMPNIKDDAAFIEDLYEKILGKTLIGEELDSALGMFKQGWSREQVYQRFIDTAKHENKKKKKTSLIDLVDKTTGKKRLLFVQGHEQKDCFASLQIIRGLFDVYPQNEWDYYIGTKAEHYPIFSHLPEVRLIPYAPFMEDHRAMEGAGLNEGVFDIVFNPSVLIKDAPNYFFNNQWKNQLQR